MSAQGDEAGARKLQEETLGIRRRILGPEHPDTSISSWSLYLDLEGAEAQVILEKDLLWLLDRSPDVLVYGVTIEQAAANASLERARNTTVVTLSDRSGVFKHGPGVD